MTSFVVKKVFKEYAKNNFGTEVRQKTPAW